MYAHVSIIYRTVDVVNGKTFLDTVPKIAVLKHYALPKEGQAYKEQ
jgi:hypothetical protein